MNILLENGLPEEYKGYRIYADFRNMIRVDMIFRDPEIPDAYRGQVVLRQFYEVIPDDIQVAMDGLEWFMHRGEKKPKAQSSGTQSTHNRGLDFEQDANRIYSSFYAAYGISLSTIDFLHWWEFMALFEGLPSDSEMMRAMYYRRVDITKLSKSEKKHAQRMKRFYALDGPDRAPMTVEEAQRQAKERLHQQYEEARRALSAKKASDITQQ